MGWTLRKAVLQLRFASTKTEEQSLVRELSESAEVVGRGREEQGGAFLFPLSFL